MKLMPRYCNIPTSLLMIATVIAATGDVIAATTASALIVTAPCTRLRCSVYKHSAHTLRCSTPLRPMAWSYRCATCCRRDTIASSCHKLMGRVMCDLRRTQLNNVCDALAGPHGAERQFRSYAGHVIASESTAAAAARLTALCPQARLSSGCEE
jgi:hypothetical protein